ETIGRVIQQSVSANGSKVRMWGDMVNSLWEQHRIPTAICLEEIWNELVTVYSVCRFCTYVMQPWSFSRASQSMREGIVQTHSSLIATAHGVRIDAAVERALEAMLGSSQSSMVRTIIGTSPHLRQMSQAQVLMQWLPEHMPILAEKILERGKLIYARVVPTSCP
ncbi:MAG: hypothetical protein Q8R91_02085, partial [Candidatus Omnitrophota bacterium]|nr:hypothetical protein [Candidatus Omnitrophota bacterium]